MPETFLKIGEVCRRVALSRSRIYALAQRGEFPKPVKIGIRASAWPESAISAWQASKLGGAQ